MSKIRKNVKKKKLKLQKFKEKLKELNDKNLFENISKQRFIANRNLLMNIVCTNVTYLKSKLGSLLKLMQDKLSEKQRRKIFAISDNCNRKFIFYAVEKEEFWNLFLEREQKKHLNPLFNLFNEFGFNEYIIDNEEIVSPLNILMTLKYAVDDREIRKKIDKIFGYIRKQINRNHIEFDKIIIDAVQKKCRTFKT